MDPWIEKVTLVLKTPLLVSGLSHTLVAPFHILLCALVQAQIDAEPKLIMQFSECTLRLDL